MQQQDELQRFSIEVKSPLWRLSDRKYSPMKPPPRDRQGSGRFDDPTIESDDERDGYAVFYCSESPTSNFVEVLGNTRLGLEDLKTLLSPLVLEVGERDQLLSSLRAVPKGWQKAAHLTSASLMTVAPVFDLTNASALAAVREHLAVTILALGHSDLDFSTVLGSDRNLTRAISRWLWTMTNDAGKPLFSGIRYRSRFDPECICLALYEGRYDVDGEIDLQDITPDTPGFAEAARILRLTIA